MTTNDFWTPPVANYVVVDKERGCLKLLKDDAAEIIPGVKGVIIGAEYRIQTSKQKTFPSAPKLDLVIVGSSGQVYKVRFGAMTYIAKWLCYVIQNDIVNIDNPVGLSIRKMPDSSVLLPVLYQNQMSVEIPKDTWATFPRTATNGMKVVDWEKVFGQPMDVVIEQTGAWIASKTSKTHIITNEDGVDITDSPF